MESSPTSPTTPPSVRGHRYVLQHVVGEGRSSVVYQGFDPAEPGKLLSIKLFRDSLPHHVRRELSSLVFLSHPQVVHLLDYSYQHAFLVMEYIPETLQDRLVRGAIDHQVIVDYLLQVPTLLALFEEREIVHGDFKASNLGYTPQRLLKALDFGLALPRRDLQLMIQGFTPLHHPPEFRLNGQVTPSHDTYGAGKTLEFLLLGAYCRQPRQALERMELFYDVSLPPSFQELYTRMVHPQHTERPTPAQMQQSVKKVVHDFGEDLYFRPLQF